MIDDDRFAQIRRLFFAEHLTVSTICRQLGVHKDAVRRAIAADAFNQRKPAPARASALDPFKPFVVEQLERYPRLRSTRIHDLLRRRGYTGSVVVVRRFVASVRGRRPREAFLVRTTLAGEEAQVDWAHFGKITVGRASRPLMAFVMVLGFSRALFVRFFHDLTTASFLEGHARAFDHFGGVPRVLLFDNLKSVVSDRIGDAIRFSDDILHLAAHYHFEPRPCAPYRGNEKGKVERAIRYLRESFFAARQLTSLDDLHRQLAEWIESVALARVVATDPQRRTVRELLALERPSLLSLPAAPFPSERVAQLRSGKTPYLRFDLNDYSIPPRFVGQPLILRASSDKVRILDERGLLVALHQRSFDSGQRIELPEHLRTLQRHKRHARELRGRDALCARCPSAAALLGRQLEREIEVATEIRALQLLVDRFGSDAVEQAIARCLTADLVRAADVERALLRPTARLPTAPLALDLSAYDHPQAPKDPNS